MDQSDSEIFTYLDREAELKKRLSSDFPEFAFLFKVEEHAYFVLKNAETLESYIDKVLKAPSPKTLSENYKDIKLSLNNFIASISTARDTFFNACKPLAVRGENLNEKITEWKKSNVTKILVTARNRLQHGSDLTKEISLEIRTEHSEEGEGVVLKLIPVVVWESVKSDLNSEEKKTLDALLEENQDTFTLLLERFKEELESLVGSLKETFSKEFKDEIEKKRKIVQELENIEKYFSQKGMIGLGDLL